MNGTLLTGHYSSASALSLGSTFILLMLAWASLSFQPGACMREPQLSAQTITIASRLHCTSEALYTPVALDTDLVTIVYSRENHLKQTLALT